MNFPFTKYSTFYYIISGAVIAMSIVCLVVFGVKFGIEFTGGSKMEVEFAGQRPSNEEISSSLFSFNLGDIIIQPTGEKGAVLQFAGIEEAKHQEVLTSFTKAYPLEEKSFEFIGPSVGNELKNKTLLAIAMALLAITAYIAFAFRRVSYPVSSWKYGVTSLIALFHDIVIPLGVFSVLGHFYNVEITIPIIAALLTILGFSVHDTIVIFDRIRENLTNSKNLEFSGIVDMSLNQTVGRSISTVATVLIVMIFMYFLGGETLKSFSLALIIGVSAGAYSSIFIASPLLVTWHAWSQKRVESKA